MIWSNFLLVLDKFKNSLSILIINCTYFATDYGHSFDKTIFYGNEWTLQLFNVMFFCVMDLATNNFVLSSVLVYLMEEVRMPSLFIC